MVARRSSTKRAVVEQVLEQRRWEQIPLRRAAIRNDKRAESPRAGYMRPATSAGVAESALSGCHPARDRVLTRLGSVVDQESVVRVRIGHSCKEFYTPERTACV